MNKLTKNDPLAWGENIFALAVKKPGVEISTDVENAVVVRYRLELRTRFQTDPKVREAIRPDVPVRECLDDIHFAVADVCREGTEEIFKKVLNELVDELETLRKSGEALFLIDNDTGKAIMPLQEKHIYTPPDFMNEAGQMQKSRPIVHPSISGPLTLHKYEKGRAESVLAKITPENKLAFAHLTDPDVIAKTAIEVLKHRGYNICELADGLDGFVEIGREHFSGMEQAPNLRFHRVHLFGQVLARRIMDLLKDGGRCSDQLKVVPRRNSKQRWFDVSFKYSLET